MPAPLAHLTVTFMDGTVQVYGLNEMQGDDLQMASRIKTMMESNFLALETDQGLILMPMYNIRSIEVSPAPPKLPDTVITNVSIVE
jgi:hypothetical protein